MAVDELTDDTEETKAEKEQLELERSYITQLMDEEKAKTGQTTV